ncbi:hypothetical protein MA16_Dca005099 [Dendrobium catenatum]|uniref:Uncharacterized protein n=1 Tax=Dendrobium catenatum TaxID=906689 RepID=A0A2I0VL88_9ASPA|nr:hypothetical protein MA16_Dca005099 [Dendrobium catenatum]
MEVDVHRRSRVGGKQDDHRPSARASVSSARSFLSSPPAFGDGNSNLNNRCKSRGTSLVISEGGYQEKKETEVTGKRKNVILVNDFKKNKSASATMFGDGLEASPSKLLPIEKKVSDNGN